MLKEIGVRKWGGMTTRVEEAMIRVSSRLLPRSRRREERERPVLPALLVLRSPHSGPSFLTPPL